MVFDLNEKTFGLLSNDLEGEAGEKTLFHYRQKGQLVTATYSGGTILQGHILALMNGDLLHIAYHCVTTDRGLKVGKALAHLSWTSEGKIKMALDWEWLSPNAGKGQSVYIERSDDPQS